MELRAGNSGKDLVTAVGEPESQVGLDEQVQESIHRGLIDFDTWTSLITKIEKMYPDNLETICSVYDAFLLEFPLCHEYWGKYAVHKARLCTINKVVEIFERAVQTAAYCVSVWVEYFSFSMLVYADPSDVRRLFKRAMSFVGKDFLCHSLWDKYIEFEFSQQQWSSLAQIYVQALKFPTKKLHRYYDNFKKFVAILKEEMELHNKKDIRLDFAPNDAVITSKDEISSLIGSLLDPSTGSFRSKALRKYISIGERYYSYACELEKKIHGFETNICRPDFHATPLDDDQLENWHQYLDFVEMQGDFDWAVKIYERCLIPCSGYPEFWMRYVEYVESRGGRELAKHALDRATKVFLKKVPEIDLFNARFKELIGDKNWACSTIVWSNNESNLHFVEKVVYEANREKRLGNLAAAFAVYEKALELAAEMQKLHTVPILYVHFARLRYLMTGKRDEARDVMIEGLRHLPCCKLLLEGLMNFLMMYGGQGQIDVVETIVAGAISSTSDGSPGLSDKDREDISVLYLQFVDLCGTIHDITKAWSRHIKLFPHSLRPRSSNKFDKPDDQLMVIEELKLSLTDNHAFHTNGNLDTTDHPQPDDSNNTAGEKLLKSSPGSTEEPKEDAYQTDKSTHNLVHEPTRDLLHEVEDDAEKEHEPLSLDVLSLNGQEIERKDLNNKSSPTPQAPVSDMAPESYSHSIVSNQIQRELLGPSSSATPGNALPELAEMGAQTPADGAVQSQNLQPQNLVPEHQLPPISAPTSLPQPQTSPSQMQSGGELGYAAYSPAAYNQMMEYYYRQQQLMFFQQQYGQQQQYMQSVTPQLYQQHTNLLQTNEQHELYVQQQQQLAQLYYQQQLQMYPQQQAQLCQQFLQQYHQGYQQVLQQQPQQPQEQQREEQWQQQQVTPTQTTTWSTSYYQQGAQQEMPQPNPSSFGAVESPHPPKQST